MDTGAHLHLKIIILGVFIFFFQVPNVPSVAVEQLLKLTHKLRETHDPTVSPAIQIHIVCFYLDWWNPSMAF